MAALDSIVECFSWRYQGDSTIFKKARSNRLQTMIGIKWTNEGTMKNHLRMMKKWIGTFKNGEHVVAKTRHTLPIMVKNNG